MFYKNKRPVYLFFHRFRNISNLLFITFFLFSVTSGAAKKFPLSVISSQSPSLAPPGSRSRPTIIFLSSSPTNKVPTPSDMLSITANRSFFSVFTNKLPCSLIYLLKGNTNQKSYSSNNSISTPGNEVSFLLS